MATTGWARERLPPSPKELIMLLTKDYSNYSIKTGDEALDKEMGDQLTISGEELTVAINDAGLVSQILKSIVKLRSERHEALIRKLA
jgi:hypothetical protein